MIPTSSNSNEKRAKIYGPWTRHDRNQIQFATRATCFRGNSNGARDLRRFTKIYGGSNWGIFPMNIPSRVLLRDLPLEREV